MLQLSYTYLRCLWKLERGYLKLKLSWFPKFLSKTVAKLHLVLLCLGKHYSTLREADRSFHCHTMSFLINQLFFFSFGGANKKVFFISKCSCSVVRRHLLSVSWSTLFSQFRRSPRIQVCKTSCFVLFSFFRKCNKAPDKIRFFGALKAQQLEWNTPKWLIVTTATTSTHDFQLK